MSAFFIPVQSRSQLNFRLTC